MKWLVTFNILVIYFIASIHSRYDEDEIQAKCAPSKYIQKQQEWACIGQQIDEAEFEYDANGTLWNLSDNRIKPYLVRDFADKYCRKVSRAIRCMRLRYNIPNECRLQFEQEENFLRTEILIEIVKMLCANDAEKLLELVQDDGLFTIYNNDIFFDCFFLIEKYPFVNLDAQPYRMNQEFCKGLDEAYECYVGYVDTHENQDLSQIAGEALTIARNVLNCQIIT